jgi:hypothetical protein
MEIEIAIEKFRRGGGTFHIDDAGALSLSFMRPGDPVPDRFRKFYPPGTPPEKMTLSRTAIDSVKSQEMETLATYLQTHSGAVKEALRNRYGTVFVSKPDSDFDMLDALDLNFLRLDFMRRDPEFSASYEQALELRRRAGYAEPTVDYQKTPEGNVEAELCSRFDLTPPFPNPDLNKEISVWIESCWKQGTRFTHMGTPSDLTSPRKPFRFSYPKSTPHKVNIELDLTRVNSLQSLMADISNVLQQHMAENQIQLHSSKKLHAGPHLQAIRDAGHSYYHTGDATYDTVGNELGSNPAAGLKNLQINGDVAAYEHNKEKIKRLLAAYRRLTENHEWRTIGIP